MMLRTAAIFAMLLGLMTIGAYRQPALAQTSPVLHVATGGKETDAEVFYAQDLGYFAKAGLNVEITIMQNLSLIHIS